MNPFQRNKNQSDPHFSTRQKRKFFKGIKDLFSPRSPSSVGILENIGSATAAPHGSQTDSSAQGSAQSQPNLATVDIQLKAAAGAINKMDALSGPFEKATLTVGQADNPTSLMDSVSSFLKSLENFNSIVDGISEIHPFAKAAWSILSLASKKLIDQKNRDDAVCSLLLKMNEVYISLTKAELRDIQSMKGVVSRISQQTLECSYFIREYAQNEKFRTRFLKNLISETDGRVQAYNRVFDELRQQFLDRATGDTLVVVHRIWKGVEDLVDVVQDVDLIDMPYVNGAGLNTQKTCLEGTRRELLDELTAWLNRTEDSTPRVFWLHGNAGTGKSCISHTIADRFKKIGRLGSCFCFDRNEMAQQRDKKLFSTIARDLADRDEDMRKRLMEAIRRDTSLKNTTDILQQWKEMILKPAQRLSEGMAGPIVIIIDGLDESGTEESRSHILRILAGKAYDEECHIAKLPPHIRILVTSRPLPDIARALNRVEHVQQKSMDSIPRESSEKDIFHFVSRELSEVEEMDDRDASTLTRASGGLFEWARLACEFIKRVNDAGATARKRLDVIVTSNKDGHVGLLDNMYKLTLKNVFPEDGIISRSTRLTLFRSVMAQIIATAEPLPRASLKSMRRYFANKNLQEIDVDIIIKPLGALLSGTTDSLSIRPLHASFPEFLSDRNRSGEFFTDPLGIHDELAFACLGVMKDELRFNICRLPSSYLPNSQVLDLAKRIQGNISSQLSYSCRFWADHLRHTSFNLSLANEIRDFFGDERLLFWFEVLSLEKKISLCTSLLSFAIEWSMLQPVGKDICDDAVDAQKFIRTFGGAISFSTPHLYVSAVPFSPKNSHISRNSGDRFRKVLRISQGRNEDWPIIQGVVDGHHDSVLCVVLSPDGNRIVSGSADTTIRLWDAETGEQLRTPLNGHRDLVYSVAFSPDGKRIVSGSRDKTIRLWDAETGEQVRPALKGHQDWVLSVGFSPEGRRIVSGSRDRTIRLWDAENGNQLLPPLEGHQELVRSVMFSPDGRLISSGSGDWTIRLWDAETGHLLRPPFEGHQDWVCSVVFSPDGKRIVSGSRDMTIRLWDVETGKQLGPPLQGHQDPVYSVAYSPDGKRIASASRDKTIRLWDAETGEQLARPLQGHRESVEAVAFCSDGKRIVSGSRDKTIRFWATEVGEQQQQPLDSEGHQHHVLSAAFSPDGKRIVSGSGDKTIRLWDADTGTQLRPPLEGHLDWVRSVKFSPDGKRIVSGSRDMTVRLWDAETGEQLRPYLEGHLESVSSVAFSPDGKRVMSGSQDKTIRIWDGETGEQVLLPLEGHEHRILSAMFSSDGKRIVSGSRDGTIRLWDTETGKQLGPPFRGHEDDVWSVGFSPEGKRIVSGSGDATIRLWDAETGKLLLPPLIEHEATVWSVKFSPDGKCIVSGSGDKTIRLWDAETGAQLQQPLEGHEEFVRSVAFSPDGKRIVSGSGDKTIRVWDAGIGGQVQPLQLGGCVGSAGSSRDGKLGYRNVEIDLKDLIRFSPQLDHGLFEPVELFDQLPPLSRSTPAGLVERSSGWVHIGPRSSLLFWSPPMYHPRLFSPSTQMIIPAPDVQLDLSNMAHGTLWSLCYERR